MASNLGLCNWAFCKLGFLPLTQNKSTICFTWLLISLLRKNDLPRYLSLMRGIINVAIWMIHVHIQLYFGKQYMYVYIFILTHRTKHDQDWKKWSHRSVSMRIENKYSTLKLGYIFSKLWLFKYLSQECRTRSWYFGYSWSKTASADDMSKVFARLLQAYKNLF